MPLVTQWIEVEPIGNITSRETGQTSAWCCIRRMIKVTLTGVRRLEVSLSYRRGPAYHHNGMNIIVVYYPEGLILKSHPQG